MNLRRFTVNTFLPGRLARLGLVLGVAVAVGSLMAFTSSLELGERPPSSLQSVTPAPDVKFIEANGLRFAYLAEGTGPLVPDACILRSATARRARGGQVTIRYSSEHRYATSLVRHGARRR